MNLKDLKGKYWHRLPNKDIKLLLSKEVTWGWICKNLKQPEWCNYPEALHGGMGCWSLIDIDIRKKISKKYCSNCDLFKD